MALSGKGGGVYIGDATPKKIAEIASWSLDTGNDEIDVTTFDSQGWREIIQGIKEWSGSFEGNFKPDDTEGQVALIMAWVSGDKVKLELQVTSTVKFSGEALVTPSIESPVDDKVSFNCSFSGTGPLTPAGIGSGS